MKHYLRNYHWLILFLFSLPSIAQNNVGIGTLTPYSKAILEIQSKDKGLLIPRMTATERLSIFPTIDPAGEGMLVFDTDSLCFFFYDDQGQWNSLCNHPQGGLNVDSLILQYASFDTLLSKYAVFDSIFAAYLNVDSLLIGGTNITSIIDSMIQAAGTIGPTGATGKDGQQGIDGKDGATGPTGAAGINGTNGKDGATGPTGAAGTNGTNGKDGATGAAGTNGTNGKDGTNGATGADGSSNAWSLTGNAGTSSSTNFLGTTDGVDLIVKTNNTERFRVLSSGNIGVGTTTPSAALMVNGDIKIMYSDAYYMGAYKGLWYNASAPNVGNVIGTSAPTYDLSVYVGSAYHHIFDHTGNVGIGTISPTQLLHINGNARLAGALYDMNNNPGTSNQVLVSNVNGVYWSSLSSLGAAGVTGATGPSGADGVAGAKGATGATGAAGTNGANGNNGATGATGAQGVTGATGAAGSSNAWGLTGNIGTSSSTNFLGTADGVDLIVKTNNVERFRVLSSGNIGVGTTTPSAAFMVNGDIKIMYNDAYYLGAYKGLWYNASAPNVGNVIGMDNATYDLSVYVGGSFKHIFDHNGNVGIGTISPTSLMHLQGSSPVLNVEASSNDPEFRLTTQSSAYGYIHKYNSTGRLTIASGGAYNMRFLNSVGGSYNFDEGSNTRMYIAAGGNVGIGTTSPITELQVAGDVTADNYNYTSPKTRYYSIDDVAFVSVNDPPADLIYKTTNGTYLFMSTGSTSGGYVVAPVNLPDGATITEVKMNGYDADASNNLNFELQKRLLTSYSVTAIASAATSGSSGTQQISATVSEVVDNSNYSYRAYIKFDTQNAGTDLRVYSIRITYTVSHAD